jgi:hypothetical protein
VRGKGHRREVGSERSMDQMCESMDKNRIKGVSAGRAGYLPRSPYPSKVRKRRSGGCAQKAAELTPGDLFRVASATEAVEGRPDRGAEVSREHSRS